MLCLSSLQGGQADARFWVVKTIKSTGFLKWIVTKRNIQVQASLGRAITIGTIAKQSASLGILKSETEHAYQLYLRP